MPTGFTAPVEDGEITELADYLQRVAGAFFWQFRDELPLGAPVPEFEIYPEEGKGYEREALDEYLAERNEILALTPQDIRAKVEEERERSEERRIEENAKTRVLLDRYASMYKKVQKWKPPTPKHQKLKDYALSQIDDSREYMKIREKPTYDHLNVEDWRAEKLEFCDRMIKLKREDIARKHQISIENKAYADALRESIDALRAKQ